MRTVPVLFAVLVVLIAPGPGLAQPDKLGSVTFPTSCDAGVQRAFERGVAMLHSYWFTEARKVFESVLQQDSRCVMAYWGLAGNSLGNSLASAPSAKDAQAASEALDRARALGARTPRERDWIEAIGAYYQNHESTPVDARLLAYTRAMEQITQRYPDDFEGWTYYALTLQASAPKQDRTYAKQLKSDYEDWSTFNDGIAYFLTVNEAGDVTAASANGSRIYSGGDWETYPPLLRRLRFSPGRIRGRAVACRVLARVDHTFVEAPRSHSTAES